MNKLEILNNEKKNNEVSMMLINLALIKHIDDFTSAYEHQMNESILSKIEVLTTAIKTSVYKK